MALRSTVFKAELGIADLDRHYYADHSLTLARHPSETDERMMVRLLAFMLNASESLEFGRGISTEDEPALWDRDLTGSVMHWIEVGQPDERLLRRACGRADKVSVYAYGRGVDQWWLQNANDLNRQEKLSVWLIDARQSQALADLAERGMRLQCTIQDGQALIAGDADTLQIELQRLSAER
ncbi:MAG: hypothetical protein CGU28_12225 [Candidatus Dactylopiibacterium carminicum]|uniref:YaeQ family protein n=1 Tax=Candidatus Dactylopiibacterium carminicum TaxID=857335 RepID=A0A272EPW8_9RHOO|nr:YaeQ family protein [Candidatus Dactylopiibacterium carminicum]KAF7598407.1 hypothetical protein BGI27_13525 [Candidatus Dactylopiibacterium carminicum]PAS92154.1 MAG: hypothetical protein CGU29_12895 [Candidatus Dactylopiibacterium carminicum]PAS95582.1 MAG: hypothetical protein CGU28_12225 [Candidatus Dactylopiibacterium carminicum]PAS97572.1 MAG: hypothetical protein BSR46_13550 [Candidatus Dactylopiibacterium carminicum]